MLAEGNSTAFLIALKDVVEAGGGVGNLAGRIGIKRPKPLQDSLEERQSDLGNIAGNLGAARLARFCDFG